MVSLSLFSRFVPAGTPVFVSSGKSVAWGGGGVGVGVGDGAAGEDGAAAVGVRVGGSAGSPVHAARETVTATTARIDHARSRVREGVLGDADMTLH